MKYLALLVLLCVGSMANAQTMKADPAYGVVYSEEQITNLPQDQNRYYVSVLGSPSEQKYQQVKSWFTSHKGLASLRNQTHFNEITTDSVMYTERYAKTVAQTPCVRVQDAQGNVIYQASGNHIPMSAEALHKGIATEFRRRRCPGPCPAPTPAPAPQPEPTPQPDVTPPQDTVPEPEPEANEPYWVVYLLAGVGLLAGIGFGVARKFKETYRR